MTKDFVYNISDFINNILLSRQHETMNSLFYSTLETVVSLRLKKIKENSLTHWYNKHTHGLKRVGINK